MYPASYQLWAVFSSRLMVLTGNVVLATFTPEGRTELGTKLIFLNGRRGPMAPGPGGALLIRCARCRCTPWFPRYPSSSVVWRPMLFSTERLHCSMYCEGACGSMEVKLTVVFPSTGGPKLKPDAMRVAGGIKLSLCWVSGKTFGTLW